MRTVFYYRSADPAILSAKAKDNTDNLNLQTIGMKFAAIFGALPVWTAGTPTPSLAGVTWATGTRPKNPLLWTDPTKHDLRRFPLPKPPKAPKLKAPHAELVKLWNDNFPADATKPRKSALFPALGLDEDNFVGNALDYFFHLDVSWIATTMPLGDKFEEVKASQYAAAHEAWVQSQRAPEGVVPAEIMPVAADAGAANE